MTTVVVPFRSSDPKRRLAALSERGRAAPRRGDARGRPRRGRRGRAGARRRRSSRSTLPAKARPTFPIRVAARALPCAPRSTRPRPPACPHRSSSSTRICPARPPATCSRSSVPMPDGGLALVAAADGTTNALALSDERLFEPRLRSRERRAVRGAGGVAAAGLAESHR